MFLIVIQYGGFYLKSSILIGFSIINHFGVPPIYVTPHTAGIDIPCFLCPCFEELHGEKGDFAA